MKRILFVSMLLLGTILASDVHVEDANNRMIKRRGGRKHIAPFKVAGVDEETVNNLFAKFASSHNKQYGSTTQYEERRNTFAKHLQEVNEMNKAAEDDPSAAKFELNGLADIEEIELKSLEGF